MTLSTTKRPSVSISIPAFNEEAALPAVLADARDTLQRLSDDWEIVVINDGSRDSTGKIADAFAKNESRVRVVHHAVNMGFGQTIKEAFTLPSKEWVFFIPGDGQIPASQLEPLLAWSDRADFILGWRVDRQDATSRKINAGVYNLLVSCVLRRRIHDVDSVVLFRRDVTKRFSLDSRSVFIHAEFLMKSAHSGARWVEVPILHRPRQGGQALGSNFRVIWRTISELVSFAMSSDKKGNPS